jgi:hypothetical protein
MNLIKKHKHETRVCFVIKDESLLLFRCSMWQCVLYWSESTYPWFKVKRNMKVFKRLFIFVNRFSWFFKIYFLFKFIFYVFKLFWYVNIKIIFKSKNNIFIYFQIKIYFIKQEYHIPKIYLLHHKSMIFCE